MLAGGRFRFAMWSSLWIGLSITPAFAESAIRLLVRSGGVVEVENARYGDVDALKVKIEELKARQPAPHLELVMEAGRKFSELAPALVLLQKTDEMTLGFITKPRQK